MLALHEVAATLEAILGTTVAIHTAGSPAELAADFAAGRVQMVWSSPVLALTADELRTAVPLVCSVRQGVAYYHSVLVVRRSSPITSALGLRGTRAVWVAPTSASGYLFPRIALAGQGVDPTDLFASETFVGAHGAVVAAVQRGEADVGATFAVFSGGDATGTLVRAGHHEAGEAGEPLRVLLATPPIPADLFLCSRALHDDCGPLLRRALAALPERVPRALAIAFGAEGLQTTTERELGELRRQLADARALGLLDRA